LTDHQWNQLAEFLSQHSNVGKQRTADLREVINGINYRWETGCVWRMLPHDFPPWETVYTYFRIWQQAGILWQLRDVLLRPRKVQQKCAEQRNVPMQSNSPLQRAGRSRAPIPKVSACFS
jgi:transposase